MVTDSSSMQHGATQGKGASESVASMETGAAPTAPSTSATQGTTKLVRRRRTRSHRKHDLDPAAKWHILQGCIFALVLIVVVFLAAKYADRWQIFKRRPAPPPTPVSSLPIQ